MLLVDNPDKFTRLYIKQGWASYGFDYLDDYDATQESAANFGYNECFTYQLADSFYGKGGYTFVIDVPSLA